MKLIYLNSVDSTNTYAKQHLHELSDHAVIVADTQTAGRGRQNRSWLSNKPGNVYLSIILKPKHASPDELTALTQKLAQAVIDGLRDKGVSAEMKPPNDVMVRGKKIAGILAESTTQGSILKGVIFGLGVNLNLSNEETQSIGQPATSLYLETGLLVERE
ncbi:MAG: biotin--[acetyl-CoA-carboxylase] ligase, partial [Candidatus Margulisiibacteriota bacterium]